MDILIICGMIILGSILFTGALYVFIKLHNIWWNDSSENHWIAAITFTIPFVIIPLSIVIPIVLGIYLFTFIN